MSGESFSYTSTNDYGVPPNEKTEGEKISNFLNILAGINTQTSAVLTDFLEKPEQIRLASEFWEMFSGKMVSNDSLLASLTPAEKTELQNSKKNYTGTPTQKKILAEYAKEIAKNPIKYGNETVFLLRVLKVQDIDTWDTQKIKDFLKNASSEEFYAIAWIYSIGKNGNVTIFTSKIRDLLYPGQQDSIYTPTEFPDDLQTLIQQKESEENIPKDLFKAVLLHESHGDPLAISPSFCMGIAQLNSYIALGAGKNNWGRVNPFNPKEAIGRGAKLLGYLLKIFTKERYGEDAIALAVTAYNAGETDVKNAYNRMQYLNSKKDSVQKNGNTGILGMPLIDLGNIVWKKDWNSILPKEREPDSFSLQNNDNEMNFSQNGDSVSNSLNIKSAVGVHWKNLLRLPESGKYWEKVNKNW